MLEELKQIVYEANLELATYKLVTFTWGNVSAIDRDGGFVIIKPSGVPYTDMRAADMVVTDLEGNPIEGRLAPSSDLQTHLVLYYAFENIGAVVHTHSRYATAFAQSETELPCMGTTHADYFYGNVPCTRALTREEVQRAYERETGNVIVETFQKRKLDAMATPAVLAGKHGPFVWGETPHKAVENAAVLEECARLALLTWQLDPHAASAQSYLLDKHYFRKHGAGAYYGQRGTGDVQ